MGTGTDTSMAIGAPPASPPQRAPGPPPPARRRRAAGVAGPPASAPRPGAWRAWLRSPWGQATLALIASRAVAWGFALHGAHGNWHQAFLEWDGGHYLTIAQQGYPHHDDQQWAFYPFYPALARTVAIGVAVSTVSFWIALRLICALAKEYLGARAARRALWFAAFFPASVYMSAYFSEGLFLCLSVGAVLAAVRERPLLAANLGFAAAFTRGNTAIALAVPLLLLGSRSVRARLLAASGPVLGVVIWFVIADLATGDIWAPKNAEAAWDRGFHGLFGAIGPAVRDALAALGGQTPARWSFEIGWLRELELAALMFVVVVMVWAFRRLPLAYGLYMLAFLALDLSFFWPDHPLVSFLRYAGALFPIYFYLGARAQGRAAAVLLLLSAGGLAVMSWRFGSGEWIA